MAKHSTISSDTTIETTSAHFGQIKEEKSHKVQLKNLSAQFEGGGSDLDIEITERCNCTFSLNEKALEGWELYKPHSQYVNTNVSSKTSSTEVLRRLLTDKSFRKVINGRKTALGRLIAGMKKAPPPPPYGYDHCLRNMLSLHEHGEKYSFEQVGTQEPMNTSDCEWRIVDNGQPLPTRKNPFREIQLCPKSLYHITQQPAKQNNVQRKDMLIDPKTF